VEAATSTGTTHGLPIRECRDITNWKKIGTMTFDAAVVSFNGDHVFHVNHPRRAALPASAGPPQQVSSTLLVRS
jgi:hypothetical protein